MIETNEVVSEQVEVAANQSTEQTTSDNLREAMWGDAPVINQQPTQTTVVEEKKEEPKVEDVVKETVVVPSDWLKSFGWDNEEVAKAEIQKLKEVKPQEEIKFANDQSKQLHELIREGKLKEVKSFLEKQEQLEQYTSSEVNPQTADSILKLQMKMKYPTLSDSQIDFQFNEDYGAGKKPVYNELKETQEEYDERLAEYNERVERVNMKKTIAATMAIPELQKIKAELVLPDIKSLTPNNQVQRQPTQEELAAEKKIQEDWAKAANSTATQFKGLSTTAKYKDGDKEVEIPVSYGLSQDEVKALTNKLSAFAESNFDPYTILKERWVDEKGNDRLDQVVEDLSWLMFGKNAAQKFANEAANARLENYLKEKKNIRVDGGGGKDFGQGAEQKTQSEQLQESFWNG